jgi:hypothetical protein
LRDIGAASEDAKLIAGTLGIVGTVRPAHSKVGLAALAAAVHVGVTLVAVATRGTLLAILALRIVASCATEHAIEFG